MKNKKSNKRGKLNIKKVINALLIVAVITLSVVYVVNLPIKRIIIEGNELVKDYEIIEQAGIKDYPKIYHLNLKTIKENLDQIDLINSVKIKRNILGNIKIIVVEDKPLCYISKDTIITSGGKKISNIITYGLPTLITEVDENTLNILVETLKQINHDELKLINEISYSPSKTVKGELIDKERFIFDMNDGNKAIVNLLNIEKFNNYLKIVNETISNMGENVKGTYHFDSATDKVTFESFGSEEKVEEEIKNEPQL